MAAFVQKVGLQVHEEDRQGQSMLRLAVGKTFAKAPTDFLQGVEASVLINLPGDADKAVAAGVDMLGLGNSSDSSPSQSD